MDKHELFAKNLEAIRNTNGQSLAEFADEIGIPKSTLQSIRISGHTTLDTAIRIAEGLHLPLDCLVGDNHLAEKLDIVQYVLQGIDQLHGLTAEEREEVILHFQKILEVICK